MPLADARRVFEFYQLEDRVLLSADGPEAMEGAEAAPDPFAFLDVSAPSGETTGGEPSEATRSRVEVIFVDAGVTDRDDLLRELKQADPTARLLTFELSSDRDGLEQIGETLSELGQLDAIHLVSHGNGKGIQLGESWIDAGSLTPRTTELLTWRDAMNADADILIYGCNLASTESGRELVESLAAICDCDVAASDDATGHRVLGGDWDLEYQVGDLQTEILSPGLGSAWLGVLDTTSGLEAHYSFDSDATDASGNGRDGILLGDAAVELTPTTSQVGLGSLSLDGAGDSVDLTPHTAALSSLSEGTLAAWVKTNDLGLNAVFEISDDPSNQALLQIENGRLNFELVASGTTFVDVTGTALINDGEWHHVAIAVSSTGNSLFIDGRRLTGPAVSYSSGNSATGAFVDDLTVTSNTLIGTSATAAGRDFNGSIDDLRVYRRALSDSDITELYESTNAGVDETRFFFSSNDDVTAAGTPGISNWQHAEIIEFGGDPEFEPAGTSGSLASVFDLNAFASNDAGINAMHIVSEDTVVAGFNLFRGDVLLSTEVNETVSGISVGDEDILLFRPTTVGDFSAGTMSLFLDSSDFGIHGDIQALTLAEESLVIGGTTVNEGNLIIANNDENLLLVDVLQTGSNSLASTQLFMDAADLNINAGNRTVGVALLSRPAQLGDSALAAGTILLTQTNADDFAGLTNVQPQDTVAIAFSSTGANTSATAATLFDGSSIGLNTSSEELHSLALFTSPVFSAPIARDDGSGMEFDGVDDYIQVADSPSLTMTNTLTMEAWINPDASSNVNRMIVNKEGEYEVALFSDGSLRWAFDNIDPDWAWHNTGHIVANDTWSHIAVSYDAGTVSTYVNGTLVDRYYGSGSIGDSHGSLDQLRIGGRQNNPSGKYFDGTIDDVRVWSTARSQDEIRENLDANLTGGETGLAALWRLDEGSGTLVADATGNGNDGVAITGSSGPASPQWTVLETDEDTALNVPAAGGLLSNDLDFQGDPVSISQVNGSSASVGSTIALVSGALVQVTAGGDLLYDPNGAFDSLAAGARTTDTFSYQVTDGNGGFDSADVTIHIVGVDDNDPPAITAPVSVSTSSATPVTLTGATAISVDDPDDGGGILNVTLSATDGTVVLGSPGLVTVTINTGSLILFSGTESQINAALDGTTYTPNAGFSGVAGLAIAVNDNGNTGGPPETDVAGIAINVSGSGVSPITDIDGAAESVAENSLPTTPVGLTIQANDPDAGDSVTYSLDNDDGGRFAVDPTSGIVTVNGPIDAELIGTSRTILARATSTDTSFTTQLFAITIIDVNEFAVSGIADTNLLPNAVAESATPGTVVGLTASALDQDVSDSVSYSLDDDAGGRFAIDGSSGVVTGIGSFDFETSASHTITVRALSSDGSSRVQSFTVSVLDINEAPSAAPDSFSVNPGETLSKVAGVLFANDVDAEGDPLLAILVSGTANGTLTLLADGSFTYTPKSEFFGTDTFAYQVCDGALIGNSVTVTLTVLAAPSGSDADPPPEPEPPEPPAEPEPEPATESPETENPLEDSGETSESSQTVETPPPAVAPPSPSSKVAAIPTQESVEDASEEDAEEAKILALRNTFLGSNETFRAAVEQFSTSEAVRERLLQLDIEQAIVWQLWDQADDPLDDSPASIVVGSAGAAVGLFSIGYVMWALRGGAFVTVMASAMPAWRFIDPVALLGAYRASQVPRDHIDSLLDG